MPQQFGAAVAKHVLRLAIGDGDAGALVDDDHRVRGRLEHRAEIGFRLVARVHLPNRAGDQQAEPRQQRPRPRR